MANDVQWIKASDIERIKPGPIRHQALPEWMLETARDLYERVGFVLVPTLEQWELGFMRDQNPERELAVWAVTAAAFERCVRRWPDRDRRELLGVLVAISMGARWKTKGRPRDLKVIRRIVADVKREGVDYPDRGDVG